ncbi:hypothetical protein CDAR_177711 [Caerostris darwini]|uniref:Uncharacterized protein n=1 Tax=Caerostris darwini TaxID=1538125 RepID=A0AAV4TZL4_9ARAC|nr:hypothetical protein CDAR_177711 [Caerostris darwini]
MDPLLNWLLCERELFRFLPLCQKCREEKQQDEKQNEWLFSSLINANQSWAFSKRKECSLLMNTVRQMSLLIAEGKPLYFLSDYMNPYLNCFERGSLDSSCRSCGNRVNNDEIFSRLSQTTKIVNRPFGFAE